MGRNFPGATLGYYHGDKILYMVNDLYTVSKLAYKYWESHVYWYC